MACLKYATATADQLIERYKQIRFVTEQICHPLKTEDYVVQPVACVSPPKWHLGHSTWFFETFILKPHLVDYKEYDPEYNYVFNSYYESIGARVIRTDRGNLSRPSVEEVFTYRRYVDEAMAQLINQEHPFSKIKDLVVLGINHEQQHQELLCTDIKFILGHNPLFPPYRPDYPKAQPQHAKAAAFIRVKEGIYEIGYRGNDFCWDNELALHKVYLDEFEIGTNLVTNKEYLEFIEDGGYHNFNHWHSEGWQWVKDHNIQSPLYWHLI